MKLLNFQLFIGTAKEVEGEKRFPCYLNVKFLLKGKMQ